MSRTLHISHIQMGAEFGSITVSVDNRVVCKLGNYQKADVRISEEEHNIKVKLYAVIFSARIKSGTNDWTLAVELKGTSIVDARLKYPLYENTRNTQSMGNRRSLYVSYTADYHYDRDLQLYLDGERVLRLGDDAPKEFEISEEPHAIKIRGKSILPYYADRISAGINSWKLACDTLSKSPRFCLVERVPYWIRIIPRKNYENETDVCAFCGELSVMQIEKAEIPAVDTNAFLAAWNSVCPFTSIGEKWVCFEDRSSIPLALIERPSTYDYRIIHLEYEWFSPHSAINMVRCNTNPVPIRDVHRGCWKVDFPKSPFAGMDYAYLCVEYINHIMYWHYHSSVFDEVSMGHYEKSPFDYHAQHEESEFADREQLMQCLIDFIPRFRENQIDAVPNRHHLGIKSSELCELLAQLFC